MIAEAELLIIDDHPLFVDGFVAMLGRVRPKWRVESGATGAEALSILGERPISAALIDVFLPDRDGFDLLHQVINQLLGVDGRVAGNIIYRLLGVYLRKLSAHLWQGVDQMAPHFQ